MYNTFEELKTLGKKLTGLKVERMPNEFGGSLSRGKNDELYIKLGTRNPWLEVEGIPYSFYLYKPFSKKYIFLQILLHEIAHYRQSLRFKSVKEFFNVYNVNPYKFEIVAERYALIYYGRFIK